jgi:hypothetical protein
MSKYDASGNEVVVGFPGPPGLNWLGAWSGATAYVVNDGTSVAGASYICILPHTNHTPPNATYWDVLASAGTGGTPATTVAGETTYGISAAVGAGTDYARNDHTHGSPALGTSGSTACAGDDSRLSDARTPTAHSTSHKNGGSDEVAAASPAANAIPKAGAGSKLDKGWVPDFLASGASHASGGVPDPGASAGTTKYLREDSSWQVPPSGGSAPTGTGFRHVTSGAEDGTAVAFGSTSGTVCEGSDSRLSDSRVPTGHHASHEPAGGDAMAVDAVAGTGSLRTLGTASTAACAGNDSRLSDTRTPTDGSVSTAKIADDQVTYAKIQNVSATDKVLGRSTTGAGDVEEIACTAAGRALLDDAAASDQRTTLGLGTLATQSGTFSGTSSGTNTGDQTNITGNAATVTTNANLTGPVTSAGNATTITDAAVTLAKMADLAQDLFIVRTTASTGVPQTATVTAAARTVLDDTTVAAMVDTLGGASAQGTGAIVRASSPTLTTPTIGAATATSVNSTTIPTSKTLVVTTDKLSVHAATSSSELAGVISDETGSGALVFGTSPTLTTPTLSGAALMAENAEIQLDTALSADGTYCGITEAGTAGATLAFGDLCQFFVTDSQWYLTDANTAAGSSGDSRGKIGICVLAGNDNAATKMLLWGKVNALAKFPTMTIGAPVYISETPGLVTSTQPTTTDVVIRIAGFANTGDELFFCPENSYITHT